MFSQWRQAVESLAQHAPGPKSSTDMSPDDHEQQPRPSLDFGLHISLSSAQLAESALTNLKKTLGGQRSESPELNRGSPSSSTEGLAKPPVYRSTLEDRLRAKFSIGDVSTATTPSSSSRASPSPNVALAHPLSPCSTSVPGSPSSQSAGMTDPLSVLSPIPVPAGSHTLEVKDTTSDVTLGSSSEKSLHSSIDGDLSNTLSPKSVPLPDSPPLSPPLDPPAILVLEPPRPPSPPAVADHPEPSEPAIEQQGPDAKKPEASSDPIEKAMFDPAPGANDASADEVSVGQAEEKRPDASQVGDPIESIEDPQNNSSDEREENPAADTIAGSLANAEDSASSELSSTVTDPARQTQTILLNTQDDLNSRNDEATQQAAMIPPPVQQDPSNSSDHIDGAQDHTLSSEAAESPISPEEIPTNIRDKTEAQPTILPTKGAVDVEILQERLKLVEQRFADVSTSFKKLQAERIAADKVLQELSPLESVQEVEALRDYLQNMNFKTEMAQDEIKRLNGKLTRQEERIEELRDIHRLESKSQTDQIDKLKGQADETKALLKASQASNVQLEGESAKKQAEIDRLRAEVERAKGTAKEEEEKRVKAVTLLKTVRQKLVKTEKERDDANKEIHDLKEKEKNGQEKEQAEISQLRQEIENINAERETAVNGLRSQFDKEVAVLKDRNEKELLAMRGQYELEAISVKSSITRELETKDSRISDLESVMRQLEGEKDEFFDHLQLRQAELESSRSRLESLEGQTTELQYQLREANDRIALLTEELADARREQQARSSAPGPSAEEVSRLLSAAEAKYETRIGDLRRTLSAVEKERDEGEAEWSRKLSEKVKELEALRKTLTTSAKDREEESESANALRKEIEALKEEIRTYQTRLTDLRVQADRVTEIEESARSQVAELNSKISALHQLLEESKGREAQFRTHNKTLREELRKVQSSAALLERQRNPGVGYWASRQEGSPEVRSPRSSTSDLPGRDSSSRPGTPTNSKMDEEINVEYLRNVILQFLEHKEMRPHLVRILSTILRFTPQETRRLISKVQ